MRPLIHLAMKCPALFVARVLSLSLRLVDILLPARRRFLGSKPKVATDQTWQPIEECDGQHQPLSVLVSLYRFSDFNETLKESINTNNCRRTRFHLLFVDSSDDDVMELLDSLDKSLNLEVSRFPQRIGIYQAWNHGWVQAVQAGSGLVTNLNADDLRRPGSLCHVAKHFEGSTASVVFGDSLLLSSGPALSWSQISRETLQSNAGQFELNDLLMKSINKPHCAPMWRTSLRNEVGFFNDGLKSSGDSEFWLRCLLGGIEFSYLPIATVAYFENPEGLSTKANSRGFQEWNQTLLKVCLSRRNHQHTARDSYN